MKYNKVADTFYCACNMEITEKGEYLFILFHTADEKYRWSDQ